jgi:hypothetical protein
MDRRLISVSVRKDANGAILETITRTEITHAPQIHGCLDLGTGKKFCTFCMRRNTNTNPWKQTLPSLGIYDNAVWYCCNACHTGVNAVVREQLRLLRRRIGGDNVRKLLLTGIALDRF